MTDDGADPELLELLRQSLGLGSTGADAPPETYVLQSAKFIYDNSVDVAIDMYGTRAAAECIWSAMSQRGYSTKTWSEHELHPKTRDEAAVNFIFTMDLLNFSFWSMRSPEERFAVAYRDKKWTGYWSLVAALQRAVGEEIPICTPSFWADSEACTDQSLRHVFRSATEEEMPLLQERMECLREAGHVLEENFDGSIINLVKEGRGSAARLVNLLAEYFPCFRDETSFEGRKVRFLKRAQIFIADLWAAFEGKSYGSFEDIDKITMFADYRVPQMLHSIGCMSYSPPLEGHIFRERKLESGHSWEIQLRGCSIWAVELIRREISRSHPDAYVNAILIDFFLYDAMKAIEAKKEEKIPHHRTRSIWY
ncbi:hypothetical protein BDY21DRAFT_279851 [Lineolata rhizophorae]|uniref:Queuosine 5'-phosphate N-glycosylase/hydrolase n=1 Tax=Lineolata rhizophorae TaxID=578093 RepID=A0A6A6PB24_9PEZI|nr:hypothetical protein BDY21DRAFT_279851 [Lineolata rhizophorae]